MDTLVLQKHIVTLATLPETEDPVISCYIDLSTRGRGEALQHIMERARLLRRALPPARLDAFQRALGLIVDRLAAGFVSGTAGAALFARGGREDFFRALEFSVPVPNRLLLGSRPSLYHIVELKDTYDRYVLVIADHVSTRILEIQLGSISRSIWSRRADLRKRVGREWSREHYRRHSRERGNQHANEVARIVDELMSRNGYGHLILAGTPEVTAMLRHALPKRVAAKLIDTVPVSASDATKDVLAATLAAFTEEEQRESLVAVERLQNEIWAHGLAVAGARASLEALENRQVDTLILAQEYEPEPGWTCAACHATHVAPSRPERCRRCGSVSFRDLDLKEELARLAQLGGCAIETVHSSETLMQLGGVGCLLRFLMPQAYCRTAA